MTKEELEKEAKEYVCKRNPLVTKEWFIDAFKKYNKGEKVKYLKDCEIAEYEAYIAGAEFGYNKGNEWHYVSEKGLPKESGRYFVYVGGGENGVYPLDFDTEANDFGYWCLDVGDNLGVRDTIFETITERNEDKVIAWKEIVLPKESEE